MRYLRQIEAIVAFGHQLESFRIGLHQTVLDAVMDHFYVMACAVRPDMRPSRWRRERFESGSQSFDRRLVSADHQAIADLQSPHAPARTGIDILNPLRLQGSGSAHV